MNGYLERQMELLQEKQNKINTEKQLLEFLVHKENGSSKKTFEYYYLTYYYFREILIKESVDVIEFTRLTVDIKNRWLRSGNSIYENYLRNYPYSWVTRQITDLRRGGI